MHSGKHWVREAQLVECLAVVVERDNPGNLLAHGIGFRIAQLIADNLSQQLQPVARLPRLNPDLPLIVAVKAECHPHDAVEAALVAMAEAHQCNLAKVERTRNGQMCRHHGLSIRDGSDTLPLAFISTFTLGTCQHPSITSPASTGL
jgi:hypothetical protein